MSASSPGSRQATKEASKIDVHPLDSQDITQSLEALCDIFATSYGPHGSGKLVHNNCGGQVTLTSSCTRILQGLSITKPVIKLISSTLQDHINSYGDCGSLVAILSLQLILKALASNINKRLIIEVYDIILKECMQYLYSPKCPSRLSVTFQDTSQLLAFIRSLFSSKPCCLLFETDLDHICDLALESFLKTFAHEPKNGLKASGDIPLMYIMCEGKNVKSSELQMGMLIQAPQIPTYRKDPVNMVKLKRTADGHIGVVLVETSMAGDSDTFADVTYEVLPDLKLDDTVLEQLLDFVDRVVNAGVGFLACQRVVHPSVKKALKLCGVLVLDRLGRVDFTALKKLAGGVILDPFEAGAICITSYLGNIQHRILNDKSYLQLYGLPDHGQNVCTVVLCHRTAESLAEVKEVFQTTQHLLLQIARQPEALCGATCWQTSLAHHLRQKVPCLVAHHTDTFGCSPLQLSEVFQTAVSALEAPAMALTRTQNATQVIDRSTGHHFQILDFNSSNNINCLCGAVEYKDLSEMSYNYLKHPERDAHICVDAERTGESGCEKAVDVDKCTVIDAFVPAVGALKTAMGIASMVLGINNYVQDPN